jgi:hypothetical protein
MMPTTFLIFRLNGYFSKRTLLFAKKPCNLAGREKAQKTGPPAVYPEPKTWPAPAMVENFTELMGGEKRDLFPAEKWCFGPATQMVAVWGR